VTLPAPELLLVGAVIAVGVLHTLVPDHWVPIATMARSSHWSRARTARAALIAGLGHTLSTLAIGVVVWAAGLALAVRFGHFVSILSSLALVAFGAWIAVASLFEMRGHDHDHDRDHRERPNARMALLLVLGSSPMVEGLPAFFAAARFGPVLLGIMALGFGIGTIATYVLLCVSSGAALQRISLGPLERYGEVLSGAVIALVGAVFLIWPLA
jgi:ABC-type nickel/cobalt efflux system permease component RcnA